MGCSYHDCPRWKSLTLTPVRVRSDSRQRVLVVGTDDWAADRAAASVEQAGLDVLRCHESGQPPFPCNAFIPGRTCPLDAGFDVVLTVRARPSRESEPGEVGVVCGLRTGRPLVVAGVTMGNPFNKVANSGRRRRWRRGGGVPDGNRDQGGGSVDRAGGGRRPPPGPELGRRAGEVSGAAGGIRPRPPGQNGRETLLGSRNASGGRRDPVGSHGRPGGNWTASPRQCGPVGSKLSWTFRPRCSPGVGVIRTLRA